MVFDNTSFISKEMDGRIRSEHGLGRNVAFGYLDSGETFCYGALLYGLSQGHTLDDMAGMTQSQRYQLGDDFIRFAYANPVGTDVSASVESASLRNIARMFTGAMDQLSKEKWPEFDQANPSTLDSWKQPQPQTARERLQTLRGIGFGYTVLPKQELLTNPAFMDSIGVDRFFELEGRADLLRSSANLILEAYPKNPGDQITVFRWRAEQFAPRYKGMQGRTLGEIDTQLLKRGETSRGFGSVTRSDRRAWDQILEDRGNEYSGSGRGSFISGAERKTIDGNLRESMKKINDAEAGREKDIRNKLEQERRVERWEEQAGEKVEPVSNPNYGRYMIVEGGRKAQRDRETEYPFLADEHKPLAAFLLSVSDRINRQRIREERRCQALEIMKGHLQNDDKEARRAIPDPEERTQLRAGIDGRIERAARVVSHSTENDIWLFVNACYDRLSGRPVGPAQQEFDMLLHERDLLSGDRRLDALREGISEQLRAYGTPGLRGLSFDDLLQVQPLPSVEPDQLRMHLENEPGIDASVLRAHVARPDKLTQTERKYATGIFDQTFSRMYDEGQRRLLEEENGMDMFDMIRINGASVRELFGEKYSGLSAEDQAEMFRCEVTAAALDGKKQITASRLYVTQEHGLESVGVHTASVERICSLPEPHHTFGERFLNRLGIRKIVPLQEQLAQANQPEKLAEAREAAQNKAGRRLGAPQNTETRTAENDGRRKRVASFGDFSRQFGSAEQGNRPARKERVPAGQKAMEPVRLPQRRGK